MTAGRPTDYLPEYCEQVLQLGRAGKSVAQIAAALDVAKQTIYDWQDKHPEFLDAMRKARDLSQSWWEDQGQNGLEKSGFQSSLWAKQVSCRFPDDYRETTRSEHTGKDGAPIKHEHAISETDKEILKRFMQNKGQEYV